MNGTVLHVDSVAQNIFSRFTHTLHQVEAFIDFDINR